MFRARMGLEKPPADFQLNHISKYHFTAPTCKETGKMILIPKAGHEIWILLASKKGEMDTG